MKRNTQNTEETRMVHINMTNSGSGTQIGCINSGLVATGPGESQARTVTEIIDDVKAEICNNYCKYSDINYTREYSDEEYDKMIEEVRGICPLNRL